MGRHARRAVGALVVAGAVIGTTSAAPAESQTSGAETFDGGLVVSGTSGHRKVVGSVVAARGAFTSVGRIVERPNRPGDSNRTTRDDLVFPEGTLHIVNTNHGASFHPTPRTCTIRGRLRQVTTIDGGTGRFANASGRFRGTVTGLVVLRRKADGSCVRRGEPLVEVDTVSASGTISF